VEPALPKALCGPKVADTVPTASCRASTACGAESPLPPRGSDSNRVKPLAETPSGFRVPSPIEGP
jgi:hypothetical protein